MFDLKDPSCECPKFGCMGTLEWITLHGGYYACSNPDCPVEIWGESDGGKKITTRDAREIYKAELRDKNLIRKHGGGSKPAGRKRERERKFYPARLPE